MATSLRTNAVVITRVHCNVLYVNRAVWLALRSQLSESLAILPHIYRQTLMTLVRIRGCACQIKYMNVHYIQKANALSIPVRMTQTGLDLSVRLWYYRIYPKYWDRHAWANSVEPDQIRRRRTSVCPILVNFPPIWIRICTLTLALCIKIRADDILRYFSSYFFS